MRGRGARCTCNPDTNWAMPVNAVQTRAQLRTEDKKGNPLKVKVVEGMNVNSETLEELQRQDEGLDKLFESKEVKEKKGNKTWFDTKRRILYRFFQRKDSIFQRKDSMPPGIQRQ